MFLVLCSSQAFSQTLETVPIKRVISLELKEQPLKLVAEEIYKQTGYRVVFDEKWNELLLSGRYVGVTLEEFFLRALRKQNVSLSYDDQEGVVILRFFGDRDAGGVRAGLLVNGNDSNAHGIDDVKVLHEQQRQDLQKYLNDPESVDPVSGMKLVDIQKMQNTQRAELEQLQKDPGTIDPESGMTNAEIKSLQNVQQAELEQAKQRPETIEPETGMTSAEIKSLQDAQQAESEQLQKHPVAEEPEKKGSKER
jgi:hypothetical protein